MNWIYLKRHIPHWPKYYLYTHARTHSMATAAAVATTTIKPAATKYIYTLYYSEQQMNFNSSVWCVYWNSFSKMVYVIIVIISCLKILFIHTQAHYTEHTVRGDKSIFVFPPLPLYGVCGNSNSGSSNNNHNSSSNKKIQTE